MKMKLIAPFKTNFNVLYFNAIKDYHQYTQFWDEIQKNFIDEPFIEVHHTSKEELVYEEIESDGNNFSPKVLTFKGDPTWQGIFNKANEFFQDSIDTYQIRFDEMLDATLCHVYDNAIGILETDIYIKDETIQKDEEAMSRFLRRIQRIGNKLMKFFVHNYYEQVVKERIKDIQRLDVYPFIQKKHMSEQIMNKQDKRLKSIFFGEAKIGSPLWVNRTLYVASLENPELVYNQWLSLGEEDLEQVKKVIQRDGFYFGWGNNFVGEHYDKQVLTSAIESVNLCQYYNVVLDDVNSRLSKLIGEVYTTNNKEKTMKRIEKILEINIENANLLFLQLNEHSLNLQGHRKKYFDDLLKKWKIRVIQENIENKITFSKAKLNDYYRKSTKLSSTVSESILFGIGGIALVDFFANISQFARTIKSNPAMSAIDDDSFGFISLGKLLSPDNMVWTGILILLFLIIVFINVRRRG